MAALCLFIFLYDCVGRNVRWLVNACLVSDVGLASVCPTAAGAARESTTIAPTADNTLVQLKFSRSVFIMTYRVL